MENSLASFSHSTEPHRLFIDRYFEELLARGIQYFLPCWSRSVRAQGRRAPCAVIKS